MDLDPNFPFALYVSGNLYTQAGRLAEAVGEFQRAVVSSGRTPKYLFMLANAYLEMGKRSEASKLLEELREQAKIGYVPPDYIGSLAGKLRPS